MKYHKYKLKGSLTIEASFLLPLLLTVMMILIQLSFYVHDRVLLTRAAYIIALRGTQELLGPGGEAFEGSTQESAGLEQEGLLLAGEVSRRTSVSNETVGVSLFSQTGFFKDSLAVKILRRESMEINIKNRAKRTNPVQIIRQTRRLEEIAKSTRKE